MLFGEGEQGAGLMGTQEKGKEKPMLLGVMTGASVPRSSLGGWGGGWRGWGVGEWGDGGLWGGGMGGLGVVGGGWRGWGVG